MDIKKILSMCDHTLLSPTATWEEVKAVCDDGIKYGTASVCIPPCYVKKASRYSAGRIKICTVIGFPNGYSTSEIKRLEAKQAVADGADEIDMVINIGALKSGDREYLLNEIGEIKKICGDRILKAIVETCLLSYEEKNKICDIVTEAGADYIKTSTGFSHAGATRDDVILLKKNVGKNVKVKAAGGIRSLADAEELILLGADRIGMSRAVNEIKKSETEE